MNAPRPARAVWFTGPGVVELRDEEVPTPGPGEIRVRAVASAISHGTELKVLHGQIDPALDLDLPTIRGTYGFPIKYGYASVGRVVDAGPGAELAPGNLVFALHPHQTEYVVPATLATRLPTGVDAETAVFLANLETAVNIVQDAHPHLGERVIVFGQGIVGLLVTQLLRRVGVGLLLAVDPLPRRRALAEEVGADLALAPSDDLSERVRALTDGAGADLVVEASGHGSALNAAIEAVAFGGTVLVSSWYGHAPVPVNLGGAFHRRRIRLRSSQVSTIDPSLQPRWTSARRLGFARDLLGRLTLNPLVSHRIPFDRAAEAYARIAQRPEETTQVILTYPDEVPDV
ncbi:MAG TPA: zinc-binding alcohol dehydrogenase [Chloroflexota bacterium]|nr:zinc-binding alcohol dehydrogenase [Chloroflexota bacterium]